MWSILHIFANIQHSGFIAIYMKKKTPLNYIARIKFNAFTAQVLNPVMLDVIIVNRCVKSKLN